jgi:hypothetical protein
MMKAEPVVCATLLARIWYREDHATDHPGSPTENAPHSSTYTHTSLSETSSSNSHTHIDHATSLLSGTTRAVQYSTIDITTTITLTPTPTDNAQAQPTYTRVDDQYDELLAQEGAGFPDDTEDEMIRLAKQWEKNERDSGSSKQYPTRAMSPNQTKMTDKPDSHHNGLPINEQRDLKTGLNEQERSEPNKLERRARTVSPVVLQRICVALLLTPSLLPVQWNDPSRAADRDLS